MFKILSYNSKVISEEEEERSSRSKYPLLLHKDERILMAFKSIGEMGRDKQYLTTHRILLKDGKGIGGKRRNYLSIPYSNITSFSATTAGSFLDCDTELKFTAHGNISKELQFAADKANIFTIMQFFNERVLLSAKEFQNHPASVITGCENMDAFMDWLGDNAHQLDAASVQEKFTNEYPVLMKEVERVQMAFKVGRDTTIITNKRFFVVDVRGWSGKRIQFESYPWSSISAFSVETAGYFDLDAEIRLYTSIPDYCKSVISRDLRSGKADLFSVHRTFCDMILGEDDTSYSDVDGSGGKMSEKVGLFTFGGDDARPLDAKEVNEVFHNKPRLLQPSEIVEMAFKGRRDMILFTPKRLISCDAKGFTGKSTEYLSIPWSSVLAFAVESAGSHDLDAEMIIYTDIMPDPPFGDQPPEPGKSRLEFDFNKGKVNILDIHRYLSARCFGLECGLPVPVNVLAPAPTEEGAQSFLSRLGDDMTPVDSREINTEFHTTIPLLLDGEDVAMAFKAGRDMVVFTNKRVLSIDTKGFSGKKKEYLSIPYQSIRGFAVESAGSWDRDSELKIYTKNCWDVSSRGYDFRKGKADIVAIQKFVAAMVFERYDDAKEFVCGTYPAVGKVDSNAFNSMLDWFIDESVPEDPTIFEQKLRSEVPVLLSDENVVQVFRAGRDRLVYTNKRYLLVDVKGWSGKKVQYTSLPHKWIGAFSIETAGYADNEAELFLHTPCGLGKMMQEFRVEQFNIMEIHAYMTNYLFFGGNVASF